MEEVDVDEVVRLSYETRNDGISTETSWCVYVPAHRDENYDGQAYFETLEEALEYIECECRERNYA